MATAKYYNSTTSQWEPILYGAQGATGATGATGPANTLNIGTVTNGLYADASITGTSPNQTLNLVLPLNANAITTTEFQTLTNKTINLANNSVSGTLAQFNTALSDADFVTIAGIETLINKTLSSPTINTPTITSPTITIGGTTVSATEISYIDGVTSAIQTQLNAKASTGKAIAMAIVFGG
jgi:hypothetical protein